MIGLAIKDILVLDTAVNNLLSGRVRYLNLPQNAVLPYVTYTVLGDTPHDTLHGMAGLFSCVVQVDCWAETYAGAVDLAEKVRLALQAYSGINKGVQVQGIYFITGMDDYVPDVENYRKILRFEIWYKRSNPS